MTPIDAIVPAHNEEPTVGAVLRTLRMSGVFRRVICVDDGSTDGTSREARRSGADVIRLEPNRGKAEAMLEGARVLSCGIEHPNTDGGFRACADGDYAFFDADLIGLTIDHVRDMARHFACGFDMVCGVQDHGLRNVIAITTMPLMTGQRFVRRWVLEELPRTCWSGYKIELALNFVTDKNGGRTCVFTLRGVEARLKQAKVGFVKGWMGQLKMAQQMREAKRSLERTGGRSCK